MVTLIIRSLDESKLLKHNGHNLQCVNAMKGDKIVGLAVVCLNCKEMLLSEELDEDGE